LIYSLLKGHSTNFSLTHRCLKLCYTGQESDFNLSKTRITTLWLALRIRIIRVSRNTGIFFSWPGGLLLI